MELALSPDIYDLLNGLSDKLDYPLMTNMYDGKYKYTLNKYKELLKNAVASSGNANTIVRINDTTIETFLKIKIKKEYLPLVSSRCREIAEIPIVEQKSPEWFRLREGMISASDAGYFLKKCGVSRALDALRIKLGLKNYTNSMAPPLLHGNTYEDISRAIYESRNRVEVAEYGIIGSRTDCIGASPDGIVIKCLDSSWECQSKYGRLLEIKNPYSREIDNDVKPEYMVQILQQQYTTFLPICDFVETTIVDKYCKSPNYKPYETLNEMIMDKLDTGNPNWIARIKNHNIPWENLNKFGNEKGVVVWYQKVITDNDIRNKYILYPLNIKYDVEKIEKWIVDTNGEQFSQGFLFKEIKYWRLDVYSEKTVVYNEKLFEGEYIPQLCDVWRIIEKCRKVQANNEDIVRYIEDFENRKDSPFYNPNKRKKLKTNISNTSILSINSNCSNDIELDF